MHGVDLNWMERFSEFLRGDAHEHRQDSVRSAHGLPAMDYFHADRRPVWRRSPGPDAFLRRAIPVHGLRPADLPGKPEATSRPASRSTHRNSITWASASRSGARRWPMPTKGATGVSMRRWPSGSSPAGEDAVGLDEELGLDLTNTVYALDSTTIALCLSVFPWAHFRTTKAAVKMHTAARPAGQHSEFYPHLGWQAARRSCPRYALAGSRSHLRRGSWLRRLCPPLCVAPSRGLLRHACQVEHRCSSRLFERRRIARPASFATRPSPWTASTRRQDYPELLRRIRFKDPESGKTLVFITNDQLLASGRHHLRALQKPLARWNSSSSGSSSIFGSSSSTARRRTR